MMSTIAAQDLFEAHLAITDLDRSVAFYRDVVGLPLAYVTASRQAAFSGLALPATPCSVCGQRARVRSA